MLEGRRPAARGRHGERSVRGRTAAGPRNGSAGDGAAAFEFIDQASRGGASDVGGKCLELGIEVLAGGEAGQLGKGVGEFDLFGGADRFPRLGMRIKPVDEFGELIKLAVVSANGPGKRPGSRP